ncbi:MAG: hypothetical protein KA378_02270, partial [Comamonas sp.]|nr:hypothetical protein [Comamonas sp.]
MQALVAGQGVFCKPFVRKTGANTPIFWWLTGRFFRFFRNLLPVHLLLECTFGAADTFLGAANFYLWSFRSMQHSFPTLDHAGLDLVAQQRQKVLRNT